MFILVIVYNPSDYKYRGDLEITIETFENENTCVEYMFNKINDYTDENGMGYLIPEEYRDSNLTTKEEYYKENPNSTYKFKDEDVYMNCKIDKKFIHDRKAIEECWNKAFEDEYVGLSHTYQIKEV